MAAVLPRERTLPGVILGYGGMVVLALENVDVAIIAVRKIKIRIEAEIYFALAIYKQSQTVRIKQILGEFYEQS